MVTGVKEYRKVEQDNFILSEVITTEADVRYFSAAAHRTHFAQSAFAIKSPVAINATLFLVE